MDKQYDLILHEKQWAIFDDPHRFRVTVNGRRFGKSALGLHELVNASLGFQGEMSKTSPQMVLGVLPTAVQARPILFKPLVNLFTTTALADVVEKINLTEMRIDIKGKPSIKIAGANDRNGDRLRGNRIYFILMDECQDITPAVWVEVIRPAMSDTVGSRALMCGTPKGRLNVLYQMSEMAKSDEEWSYHTYPTSSNPCIPREEIAKAKASLPPRVYAQEYEADFVNYAGQIWTELDSKNMVEAGEPLPHFDLVVMGVDHGDRHPAMVVIAREPRFGCWYILDAWSPNTSGIGESQPVTREEFQQQLVSMVDAYDVDLIYCDPSRPSDILAIRKFGDKKCYKSTVEGYNKIESGISQVHNLIHQNKLKIVKELSPSLKPGIVRGQLLYDYLSSYQWELDKAGQVTEVPADGNCSHICDALRYALAIKGG